MTGTPVLVLGIVTSMGRATAEDASQMFGGPSVTQPGMGKFIENVS